ncbi:MAG: hypothetical protein JF599_13990 [Verrucomicrobia bacterium]|nr:hypothetical protein [Verrucomicrobiota bacterium]
MISLPDTSLEGAPLMNDPFVNGRKWHEMAELLTGFYRPLHDAGHALDSAWQPPVLPEGTPWEDVWEDWAAHESAHLPDIYDAARMLVRTTRIPTFLPAVLYFLRFRHRAALDHVQGSFSWRDERPVSLIPFPSIPPGEFAEWLLTEWGNNRGVLLAFPEAAAL